MKFVQFDFWFQFPYSNRYVTPGRYAWGVRHAMHTECNTPWNLMLYVFRKWLFVRFNRFVD